MKFICIYSDIFCGVSVSGKKTHPSISLLYIDKRWQRGNAVVWCMHGMDENWEAYIYTYVGPNVNAAGKGFGKSWMKREMSKGWRALWIWASVAGGGYNLPGAGENCFIQVVGNPEAS